MSTPSPTTTPSPFGGIGQKIRDMACAEICSMYLAKCGVDVSPAFAGLESITQYQCATTGMKYWRPTQVAGDEAFYAALSTAWPNYYKTDRWEYQRAIEVVSTVGGPVLEVGCGRGYFLRRVEGTGHTGMGLELNRDAIQHKVTNLPVHKLMIEDFKRQSSDRFAVVCSFQVLEHVVDPAAFIRECASLLRPSGRLVLSTPNEEFEGHASDPFDKPPHHMNQFTPEVYRRIAHAVGMDVCSIDREMWAQPRAAVYSNPGGSAFNRGMRRAINKAARWVAGTRPVLGASLVCVMQLKA